MHNRKKKRLWRWIGRIILIFFGLVLIATALFYIKRDKIKERALVYLNDLQPGEIYIKNITLIPFLNFPMVSVRVNGLSYFEQSVTADSLYQVPVLSLDNLYASLDIRELIRGDIKITRAILMDGSLNIIQYDDSTTNIENAIGFRFLDKKESPELDQDSVHMNINLDKLRISNLSVCFANRQNNNLLELQINKLFSKFSYLQDKIETGLKFDVNLNELIYQEHKIRKEKNIQFDSDVLYDRADKKFIINPSMVNISNTMLEVWGEYLTAVPELQQEQTVDLTFRAINRGIELLNSVFYGILNMNEIEQTGSGSIYLSGSVKGTPGMELPVIRLDVLAENLGFNIKSLNKEVRNISFSAFASNGKHQNLSDAVLIVRHFNVRFPNGSLMADFSIEDAVSPKISMDIDADLGLDGLDKMINTELIRDLGGRIDLRGSINGTISRETGEFLDDAGTLLFNVNNLRCLLPRDTLENASGSIYIEGQQLGIRDLEVVLNGNHLFLDADISNLFPYLYGMKRDIDASLSLSSEVIYPERLLNDTVVQQILGKEIRGLQFSAKAGISHYDLDNWLSDKIIPSTIITLENFQTELSSYANISEVKAVLEISPDTLNLKEFSGRIGESGFNLNAMITDYDALIYNDSTASVSIDYLVESGLMRAEDFFTVNNEFILPQAYRSEYLENFLLRGKVIAPVADIMDDNNPVNFAVLVDNLQWKFKNYPLAFRDFYISAQRQGNEIIIDNFQGKVGDSNIKLHGVIGNNLDSAGNNFFGKLAVESNLLDFNELFNYQVEKEIYDSDASGTTTGQKVPPKLHEIDYPDFELDVDIRELRYDAYRIFGMLGKLRSTGYKIFYLDSLITSVESGGKIFLDGQFNVANPYYYTLSANLWLDDVNVRDLEIQLKSDDEIFTLAENFAGLVDAKGMAEIFLTPDFNLDMTTTTAIFNVTITDGALIKFTPLEAAGKYLGNKSLDYVKFADLRNRFTLMDSRIVIPLMSVGSTIGQILIEGEQGLDKSYVYLLRLPMWLVRGAARNMLIDLGDDEPEEEQIYDMQSGKFMKITVWGDKYESDMKFGDKRDRL